MRRPGGCGPLLMASGAMLGLVWPDLAAVTRPLFPLALLSLAFAAFLRVSPSELLATARTQWRLTTVVLIWTSLGAPVGVAVAVHAAGVDPALAHAVVLAAAGPCTLGAAGIATMLRLDPVLPAAAALAGMVLAPLTVPALSVAVLGIHPGIDPAAMVLRLVVILGAAAALAALARRTVPALAHRPAVASSVTAIMQAVFAIGAVAGLRAQLLAHPAEIALLVAVSVACNAGAQAAGALLFAGLGPNRAMAVGIASGTRNVSVQWTALGSAADGLTATYFAICMLVSAVLPLLQQAASPYLRAVSVQAGRIMP